MSLLAMPMVIINLGSEMMYILEQRLKVGVRERICRAARQTDA
jgi:hypothetical protein